MPNRKYSSCMKDHVKSSLYNLSNLTIKKCVLFESQAEGFYFILFSLFFEGGEPFLFCLGMEEQLEKRVNIFFVINYRSK